MITCPECEGLYFTVFHASKSPARKVCMTCGRSWLESGPASTESVRGEASTTIRLDGESLAAIEAAKKAQEQIRTLQRAVLSIAGMVTGGNSPFGRIPIELLVDMESIGSDLANWAEAASDQEIIDHTAAQGLDPQAEAEHVRQTLLEAIRRAKAEIRAARKTGAR